MEEYEHYITQVKEVEASSFKELIEKLNDFFAYKWVTASPIFEPKFDGDLWRSAIYYKVDPNSFKKAQNNAKTSLESKNIPKSDKIPIKQESNVKKPEKAIIPATDRQIWKLKKLGIAFDKNITKHEAMNKIREKEGY